MEKPTFTPSLRYVAGAQQEKTICHLNITDGNIIYHFDCPHEYAGKTIPMAPYDQR
jgi:hypothetical protein